MQGNRMGSSEAARRPAAYCPALFLVCLFGGGRREGTRRGGKPCTYVDGDTTRCNAGGLTFGPHIRFHVSFPVGMPHQLMGVVWQIQTYMTNFKV